MSATIEQLQAFVATVDKGSFKQAALRLGKHNTTISGLVASLEAELGLSLFERKPRSLELTAQGKDMYHYAVAVLRESDQLLMKADSLLAGEPSRFVVGLDTALRHPLVMQVIDRLIQKYPSMQFTLLSGDPMLLRSWLLSGQADMCISTNTFQRHHELSSADGFNFEVINVANPQLQLKQQVVKEEKLRGMTQVATLFMKVLGQSDTHNFSNRLIYSNNNHDTLALVKHSLTWAILPAYLCKEALERDEVHKIFITKAEKTRANIWSSAIYWPSSNPLNAPMHDLINGIVTIDDM
ncbi:LysR family transcriptional regulator [Paraferrimonas haliotis]|uniref:Transcriptional regulator n=1 Tax=Paraferrimonas haliotis TaxID=2013866 RepID=A0AA37TTC2_9GAMM|nr:LysR family transcriptional regulator [Paraferrimonas haliotis]GLS84091.1 transcriptional regulator [Paraferrimonas haliotis]